MVQRMQFRFLSLLFAGILIAGAANAATAFGVTSANNLIRFNTAAPGTIVNSTPIIGLQAGESILGIDFRPVNGVLYGLGSTSRIYTIDVVTGAATAVNSTPFTPALSGTAFGFDFNPTVDRIRVVSDAEQNFRLDPNTGQLAFTVVPDGALNPGTPDVVAAGYTNNFAGATTTTLYVIDVLGNQLMIQNPPNNGTLTPVGAGLGFNPTAASFDIETVGMVNTGYAALNVGTTGLYTINLTTGAAAFVGNIGTGTTALTGFAIAPQSFTCTVTGTSATFTGSVAGDRITLDQAGGLLRHNRFSLGDSGFNSDFDFNSGVAGDQTLSATDPAVSITINVGDRDDTVTIGSSTAPASGLAATFIVDGEGGGDELIINDTADITARTLTLDDADLSGIVTINQAGLELIRINCGTGADTVNVFHTNTATVLNTGDGDDTISLIDFGTLSGGLVDGGTGSNVLQYTRLDAAPVFDTTQMNTVFLAKISGQQEPGPLSSSQASGFGYFMLNSAQTALTFNIEYAGLTGSPISGTHFHNAATGVNGTIVRMFTNAEQNGLTTPSGVFTGTWTSADSEPLTAALVTELLANRIYTNIHTLPNFPSGEIRGQLINEGVYGRASGTAGVRNVTIPNTAPAFASTPFVSPNPPTVNVLTTFTAFATDAENDPLTCAWNFGDGSTASGPIVTHIFGSAGTFTVTVTATDSHSAATSTTLSVTVAAAVGGTATDTDGDGFSDIIETAAGTAPNNPAQTPIGNLPAPLPLPLPDAKLSIKLNFAKTESDSLSLSGSLLLSEGFDVANATMLVQIGDLAGNFMLDPKGVAKTAEGTVSVKSKGTAARIAKFSVKLSKTNLASALASAGLTNETVTKDVTVPLTVIFNSKIFQKLQAQSYKAAMGKGGSSKDKKK